MKYAAVDASKLPIIVITFASYEPKESEFDEYLAELDMLYENYTNFVIVFNASVTRYLPSNLRLKQAYWLKNNAEKIKRNCLGTAYFIPNILTSALLNCIFAISKPSVDYTVTTTFDKSMQWAEDLIAKKNGISKNSSLKI